MDHPSTNRSALVPHLGQPQRKLVVLHRTRSHKGVRRTYMGSPPQSGVLTLLWQFLTGGGKG